MKFIPLTSEEDKMFSEAMELYKISFPPHEQRSMQSQKEIFHSSEYHFDLIYDEAAFVGILLTWETDAFIYVEHFCIRPELRKKQYGQRALSLLGQRGKTVILEIDPPEDEISVRRLLFYQRCGYEENPFSHIHPPYHKENKGHALVIMSYPHGLTQAEYDHFYFYLQNTVMKSNGLF